MFFPQKKCEFKFLSYQNKILISFPCHEKKKTPSKKKSSNRRQN